MTVATIDDQPTPAASRTCSDLLGNVWRFLVQAFGEHGCCAYHGPPLAHAAPVAWREDMLDELLDIPGWEQRQ